MQQEWLYFLTFSSYLRLLSQKSGVSSLNSVYLDMTFFNVCLSVQYRGQFRKKWLIFYRMRAHTGRTVNNMKSAKVGIYRLIATMHSQLHMYNVELASTNKEQARAIFLSERTKSRCLFKVVFELVPLPNTIR